MIFKVPNNQKHSMILWEWIYFYWGNKMFLCSYSNEIHPILFYFSLYIPINEKTYERQVVKNGQDYDWTICLDETKEIFKTLFLIGPKEVQETSDMVFPLFFWSFLRPHLVEGALLMEEGTRWADCKKPKWSWTGNAFSGWITWCCSTKIF